MVNESDLGWYRERPVGIPMAHPKNSGIMAKHISQQIKGKLQQKLAPKIKAKSKVKGLTHTREVVTSNKVHVGPLKLGRFY